MVQFSRTVAPEPSKGPALIVLMEHYKWKKAVLLTSTTKVWFQSGLEVTKQLQGAGIEMLRLSAFEPGSVKTSAVRQIKRSGIRIVLLMAFDEDTHTVASSAAIEGMGSMGWAWSSENRIETLSARRVAWFVLVQLVRIAVALFLGLGGVLFLSRTIGLEQLLRTTVALAFIRVSGRS